MICLPVCIGAIALLLARAEEPATRPIEGLQAREKVGAIEHPAIKESSGLVASRRFDDVYWTHNDSGHPATLFAIDRAGRLLAEYKVAGRNVDWEDIAIDDAGRLYIADIGNNQRTRGEIQVLVVGEPDPSAAAAAERLVPERIIRLRYPDRGRFESEAIFIHDGAGYLISKQFDGGPARLYRFELAGDEPVRRLEAAGELPVRSPVTAADISRDGSWLAVMTVTGPSLFEIKGGLETAGEGVTHSRLSIDAVAEAITFTRDGLLVTNEAGVISLFRWKAGG